MNGLNANGMAPRESQPGEAWLRLGITLWVILAVAVTAKTLVQGGEHSVYEVFAQASQHWWADLSLYDSYEGIDIYRYSPTFAVGFTPFSLLPSRLGNLLWNLPSIALLFWSLRLLVHDVLPGEWPPWREGVFLGLTALLSIRMIWSAQSNTLLIALVILSAVAILRQRWWTASCLLAVPVFIKLWPMAVVLLLMACWPRQLIWRFPVPVAALAAAPFLTRPLAVVVQQYRDWFDSLTGVQQGRWLGFRDFWTIWEELWPPVNGRVYMLLQLGTAALVLAWCLRQRRRAASPGHLLILILSIWAAWQLLFGPGTERLTYGIIGPSLAWAAVATAGRKGRGHLLIAAAFATVFLFGLGDIEKQVLPYLPFAKAFLPTGVALFALWLIGYERGRAPPEWAQGAQTAACADGDLLQTAGRLAATGDEAYSHG